MSDLIRDTAEVRRAFSTRYPATVYVIDVNNSSRHNVLQGYGTLYRVNRTFMAIDFASLTGNLTSIYISVNSNRVLRCICFIGYAVIRRPDGVLQPLFAHL